MMLTPKVPDAELERSIELCEQGDYSIANSPSGHWVFELEVDAIHSEQERMSCWKHYLGERDELGIESKIARLFTPGLSAPGNWPLVYNGVFDLSASVKAYFALKMIGDRPDAEHMQARLQSGDP